MRPGVRQEFGQRLRDNGGGGILQPRIERHRFLGPQDAQTLPNEGRLESFEASRFEAEITSAHLGEVVLRRTVISPHRAILGGRARGLEAEMLRLVIVRRGTVFAAPPGGDPERFDVGDALFACGARPYVYQTTDRLESVGTTLPVSSLPSGVRRLDLLPAGPLPRSPLVDAVVELLFGLADRLHEQWAFDANYTAQGLIDLEAAILTEVIGPHVSAPGLDRIHDAAIDYIDLHLAEPDLSPSQIAEGLGVSVRYLHQAFEDKDVTVARYLRRRRLVRVAATLRISGRTPAFGVIAQRFGFRSQDQLARAFHRHYGVSMTAYRRSATL